MTTSPTPSDPIDENDPTPADRGDAPAAGSSDAPAVHDAPLIDDVPPSRTAEPLASDPVASDPARGSDSRWAPPPARPEPETASASPAPDLVEPEPAPAPMEAAPIAAPAVESSTDSSSAPATTDHAPASDYDTAEAHGLSRTAETPASADSEPTVAPAVHAAGDAAHPDREAATVPAAAAAAADAAPAGAPAPTTEPAPPAAPQVVYVPAPTPPRKKGNRGMGVGIALAATPVFAAVYAALALLFVAIGGGGIVAAEAIDFFLTPSYYLPIVAFALFYVLLALIVNRAGWWAHVLGAFIVAVLVYATFIASSLLTANAVGAPADLVAPFIAQQLTNPIGWAAAIAAREVPVWVGGLVAKRGRTVKSRNVEAREAYERELAESRAGRPAA
ncbi:hypothetical protein OVN18_06540 [Microcella daejeonensis]|uniref:Uncharacterized protein n=1 Tax=Microcella daejeonensis TaxID=2994971 RepID=A0A9E8MPF8_9MICO|nr:hypothetical protein [Microcella daejeonensis]WAB82652.1 hypothetical protein OVN18_06540 [Microcella daejeonensis]